jgi:hypothetical protein
VLPLRDHITDYYAFVPAIGLCWLGGWALAQTFRSGSRAMYAALALAGVYIVMAIPRTLAASDRKNRITMRARDLVEGLATAGELHPGKTVLLANPLAAPLLGPGWYAVDGNHRWMAKRATLRLAGGSAAGQKLYLRGSCPEEQLRAGPLEVTVAIDGVALPAATIRPGENSFELAYGLPEAATGRPVIEVAVEVARTFHTAADRRDLGLAFGVFEIR